MEPEVFELSVEVEQAVDAFYLPEEASDGAPQEGEAVQEVAGEGDWTEEACVPVEPVAPEGFMFINGVLVGSFGSEEATIEAYGSAANAIYIAKFQEAATAGDFAAMDALTVAYNEGAFGPI